MDMSLVASILSMQAGATQTQVATAILKQNNDAEKSAVQTLLGTGQSSPASLPAGVGGNLDISA
jgi:Putative motility protein